MTKDDTALSKNPAIAALREANTKHVSASLDIRDVKAGRALGSVVEFTLAPEHPLIEINRHSAEALNVST